MTFCCFSLFEGKKCDKIEKPLAEFDVALLVFVEDRSYPRIWLITDLDAKYGTCVEAFH